MSHSPTLLMRLQHSSGQFLMLLELWESAAGCSSQVWLYKQALTHTMLALFLLSPN